MEPFWSFKLILKIEILILTIIFIISIIYNLIPNKIKLQIRYYFNNVTYSNINNKNANYEIIKNSIDNNAFINKSEKDFIKQIFEKEFKENYQYINIQKIANRLENLKISNYNNKNNLILKYNSNYSKELMGDYNVLFNEINVYNSNNILLDNNQVFFHELNHLATDYTLDSVLSSQNRSILTEIVNEMFAREYFEDYLDTSSDESKSYEKYMIYIYLLTELLSEKTIKEYKFNDNENILISELLRIDNNIEEAYNLIDGIKKIDIDNSEENCNKIYNAYVYFYEKKYNNSILNNLVILSYLYGSDIQTDYTKEALEKYLKSNSITNIKPKGYISDKCKEKNKNVILEYIKNGKKETIEVFDFVK